MQSLHIVHASGYIFLAQPGRRRGHVQKMLPHAFTAFRLSEASFPTYIQVSSSLSRRRTQARNDYNFYSPPGW